MVELVLSLSVAIGLAIALNGVMRSHPGFVYATAVGIAIVAVVADVPVAWMGAVRCIDRCLVAFALFTIVMYIGILPKGSALRRYLAPVRGPLSIVASILTVGHIANYFESFFFRFVGGFVNMGPLMVGSFAAAALLVVLLGVLALTSFEFVRSRMPRNVWRAVQKLAYPFYALIFLHVFLILGPSAIGGSSSTPTVVLYAAIGALYTALRIVRLILGRKSENES